MILKLGKPTAEQQAEIDKEIAESKVKKFSEDEMTTWPEDDDNAVRVYYGQPPVDE